MKKTFSVLFINEFEANEKKVTDSKKYYTYIGNV